MKYLRKTLSFCIAFLLMVQCVPLQVFSLDNTSKIAKKQTEQEKNVHILGEVKSKRTGYTKTFILSDGSYCDIYSSVKLHEEVNGKMENIYSDLNRSYDRIEDIQAVISSKDNNRTSVKKANANKATDTRDAGCQYFDTLGTSYPVSLYQGNNNVSYSNEQLNVNGNGIFILTMDNMRAFNSKNIIITSAALTFTVDNFPSNSSSTLSVYEGTSYWQNHTTVSSSTVTANDSVCSVELNGQTNISFDILDYVSRCDRGLLDYSNGLYFLNENENCTFSLSNPIILITYKEYGYDDINCTYHSIDLGDKCQILINDFTNTITLKQNLIGIDVSTFPVDIIKYGASTDIGLSSQADMFSTLNYNSSISLDGTILTWKMFDGSEKVFVQPTNHVLENGMETWIESESTQTSQTPAVLYIDEDAIDSEGMFTDYEFCSIQYGTGVYSFDASGFIRKISSNGKEMNFTFANGVFTRIVDGLGNKYSLNYSNQNGTHVSKITVKDSTNNNVMLNETTQYKVEFNWTIENSLYKSQTNYADGTELVIYYDNDGRIVRAEYDEQNIDFNYRSSKNYLTSYTISFDNSNDINEVEIDDTYVLRRIFTSSHMEGVNKKYDKCDVIDYNKNGNIMSSQTIAPDGTSNLVCYQYDSYGNISSFALEEETNQIVSDGDMNTGSPWTYDSNRISFTDGEATILSTEGNTTSLHQSGISLIANKTYVLSTQILCDRIKTDSNSSININITDSNNTLIASLPLLIGSGVVLDENGSSNSGYETKRIVFTPTSNIVATLSFVSSNQENDVNVNYIYINESKNSGYCNGVLSNNSNVYDNYGNLLEDVTVCGNEKLLTSFLYDSNNNITSLTNQNGVTEYYAYNDNGLLSEKGTIKDQNGTIVDPVSYAYNSIGVLESVSQTLSLLNSSSTTQTSYEYSLGQVSKVSFNNISYCFDYAPNGRIKRISLVDSNNTVSDVVNQSFTNDNVTIVYANNSKVECLYDDGKIVSISYYTLNNNTYTEQFSYTYSYNNSTGELESIFDNDHLTTEFLPNGYQVLYKIDSNTNVNIYKKETDSILNIVTETYFEDIFTSGNTPTERCVTTPVVITPNNNGKTKNQIINSSKIYSSAATNHPSLLYNAYLSESSDLFDRTTGKSASLNFTVGGSQSYSSAMQETISYKQLSAGDPNQNELSTTSNLVSQHSYTYTSYSAPNNPSISFAYSYDYYANGKLKMVSKYIDSISTVMPVCYYEYDNAGRITLEYTLSPQVCMSYQYDNYGNLIQRALYAIDTSTDSFEEVFFKFVHKKTGYVFDSPYTGLNDDSFNADSVYSSIDTQFNYLFNSSNKELLSGFQINGATNNSYTVTLDDLGQPTKNYFYPIYQEGIDSVDCEWTGNLLTACENDNYRIEYTYDVNGYLASKKIFNERNGNYEYAGTIFYNWDNGILQGLHFLSTDQGNLNEGLYTDILYDISGEPIGIQVPSGIQYYFGKDCNGNVSCLLRPDGYNIADLYYDAFGMLGLDVHGENWIEAIINAVTGVCNPISYGKMIYDYQTGIYFDQGRCYSAFYGRYMNIANYNALNKVSKDPNTNPYVFAKDDPINNTRATSDFDVKGTRTSMLASGFDTDMTTAFLSRTYCAMYTKMILKQYGIADETGVLRIKDLTKEEIESSLFAHTVGRYCEDVLNRINSVWCDEWLYENRYSNIIHIDKYDRHYDQYLAIWNNAELIKEYSFNKGIFIGV